MIIELRNQVQNCRFAATGRAQDRCERAIGCVKADVLEDAEPLTARKRKFFGDICECYCAHFSAGTPVRHRVRRCSMGLKSRYSMANMTNRKSSVQANTCAMENNP